VDGVGVDEGVDALREGVDDPDAEPDGAGSAEFWLLRTANSVPPRTSSSSAMRATSGQVHGLRFFFCARGSSSVCCSVRSDVAPAAGSRRVAAEVCPAVSS